MAAFFWFFGRGDEIYVNSSVRAEGLDLSTPIQSSEDHRLVARSVSGKMESVYRLLARSTVLPDHSVDVLGKTLPKEFVFYLSNQNAGYDQFVSSLTADGLAAFNTMKQSIGSIGMVGFIEFVAKNNESEKPSAFDFILYSSLKDLIHEYPAISHVTQGQLSKSWSLLAQSKNPVFRLLALDEVHRIVKDKAAALALLNSRMGEVDSAIVLVLIDQFSAIGGDSVKTALMRISKDALARGDRTVSKYADDAVSKLK